MPEPSAVAGTVFVVVVNWNGWRDTIECLESVFHLQHAHLTVVVLDNGSSDGSLEKIRAWARGELLAEARNPALLPLIEPRVPKPISVVEAEPDSAPQPAPAARLVLIPISANLGYAGANNIGIRYALARSECTHIWLLNNDTVVTPGALAALLARMAERPEAGMCGPVQLYYDQPQSVCALGGAAYSAWTARHRLLYARCPADALPHPREVERRMHFVSGAAMLVSRRFVECAGLLSEDYFLYAEEMDWMLRGRPRFSLAYCPASIVYHKEGASVRRGSHRSKSGARADFWLTRSRLLFTRRHFRRFLPTVSAVVAVSFAVRLARGRFSNCRAVWAGFRSGCALSPSVEAARKLCARISA
jgi:GT2 family glycosyltransferase